VTPTHTLQNELFLHELIAHCPVARLAVVTGTLEFPLSEIPFRAIVDLVEDGTYKAKPAKVFRFDEIQAAHRMMESGSGPGGKLVVKL